MLSVANSSIKSLQILRAQLDLLGVSVACARNDGQEFDESKVKRGPGGKFGSKPTAPPDPAPTVPKPQVSPELLEKQRQLKDRVEEITQSVREAVFGTDAIARLQSLSSSFKKSLDQNKVFRHAQIVTQGLQAQESLEKALESAISQYRGLVEQVKKGRQPEEIAGIISATSSTIGGIVGSLHGHEALSQISEILKQKQFALDLEDIASRGKPLGHFQDMSQVAGFLKEGAARLVNTMPGSNKRLI